MGPNKKINSSTIVKGNDKNTIQTSEDIKNQGFSQNKIYTGTGLMNTTLNRTPFSYNKPDGASMFQKQGAYIVFGQVPYSGMATGYGAKGMPADSIDLVVGRHASSNGGKGPKKNSVVDNNFASDAARVYISKLCDIDVAFGLESAPIDGGFGKGLVGRSGIGIKADGVRVIGREGVKIVTGKMNGASFGSRLGELNSLGGKYEVAAPIDLVAGNNYDNIQGVGLGKNIRNCLLEILGIMEQMWGSVFNASKTQMEFNSILGISPLPHIAAAGPWTTLRQGINVLAPLYHTRVNLILEVTNNYLNPYGNDYIVSRGVRVN